MRAEVLIPVANIVATVLTSLAVANAYPAFTAVFAAVAGILVGWVNLHKPKKESK